MTTARTVETAKMASQYQKEATKIAHSLDCSFHKWTLEMRPTPSWEGYMVSRLPVAGRNLYLVIGMAMEYEKYKIHTIAVETGEAVEKARQKSSVHGALSSFITPQVGMKTFVSKSKIKSTVLSLMKGDLSPAVLKDSAPYIEKAGMMETASSRKMFNSFAALLKAEIEAANSAQKKKYLYGLAADFARMFASTNPLFDRKRFLLASGVKNFTYTDVSKEEAKLSKKYYVMLAGILSKYRMGIMKETVDRIADGLSEILKIDNPSFNKAVFMQAVRAKNTETAAQKYHRTLNPKLFDNNDELRQPVRAALLKVAKAYQRFLYMKLDVADIIIKGSNVNFNYSPYSDIDLHLFTPALTKEQSDTINLRNQIWKAKYKDIKIKDIPVEVGVDTSLNPSASQGIYSISDNVWISKPKYEKPIINNREVRLLAKKWEKKIHQAFRTNDPKRIRDVYNEIISARTNGTGTVQSEFQLENMAFKELRNTGLFDDLRKMIAGHVVDDLSLSPDNPIKEAFIKMSRFFRKPGLRTYPKNNMQTPPQNSPQTYPAGQNHISVESAIIDAAQQLVTRPVVEVLDEDVIDVEIASRFMTIEELENSGEVSGKFDVRTGFVDLSGRTYYVLFGLSKKTKKWQFAFGDHDKGAVAYELDIYRDGQDEDELSRISNVISLKSANQSTIDEFLQGLESGNEKISKSFKVGG